MKQKKNTHTAMPKFSKGDKVWYIPDHAEDASHSDAEVGVVEDSVDPNKTISFYGSSEERRYFVNYNDGSSVAKLTYERHLEPREE